MSRHLKHPSYGERKAAETRHRRASAAHAANTAWAFNREAQLQHGQKLADRALRQTWLKKCAESTRPEVKLAREKGRLAQRLKRTKAEPLPDFGVSGAGFKLVDD